MIRVVHIAMGLAVALLASTAGAVKSAPANQDSLCKVCYSCTPNEDASAFPNGGMKPPLVLTSTQDQWESKFCY
jgi:hypothetical protein